MRLRRVMMCALALAALAGRREGIRQARAVDASPACTTSWIGNSFGGPQWVQTYADALYTAPDGRCYLATLWDEGGHEFGIYKDGRVAGAAAGTHGWGYGGGYAVTASSRYLFIAQQLGSMSRPGWEKNWPEKGKRWFGVGRRRLDGSLAPFPGGLGPEADASGGAFMPVNTVPEKTDAAVRGLAASDRHLFVSNPYAGEIDVYDPETMAKTGSWPVPDTGQIACDAAGDSLWVVQSKDSAGRPKILHFSAAGKPIGEPLSLPAGTEPSGLCATRDGRLLVADAGLSNRVLIYGDLKTGPKLTGSFGEKGGIDAGTPGRAAPLKFSSPAGVGVDGAGNIYVASRMNGAYLESYAPDGKRNWELHGLEFTSCADIDPESPDDVYTATHHYRLDLSKPSGKDSRFVGYLVDRSRYPKDPRLTGGPVSVFVRRIQGKRFLFGLDMNAGTLQVFRFSGHGDVTAPSAMFRPNHLPGDTVPEQPASNGWIWRDADGDGVMEPGEFESTAENVGATAWSVDSRGDVWQAMASLQLAGGSIVKHFPCKGLDPAGNPIYSARDAIVTPAPAPFDDVRKGGAVHRMQYIPETDTMYLSGFTAAHPNDHRDWKTTGPTLCRYDDWSSHPVKRWQIDIPFESAQTPGTRFATPVAFSVAGNRVFVGYLKDGEIKVFDAENGRALFSLLPGPEADRTSGWIDTMYGVRAEQLKNGEYLVFAEEVLHEKVLMYRLPR